MSMPLDTAAAIVGTLVGSPTATAYAATDPSYGILVLVDETWFGGQFLEYVRIDGLGTRGYATSVELRVGGMTVTSEDNDADPRYERVATRIRDAINAVVSA